MKKARKNVAEVSEETIKIQAFLEKQKEGMELSWETIETETGIEMDMKGKQYTRSALHRANLEYASMHGWGIKLADTKSVMPILTRRIIKIDNSVKRGDKTQHTLQAQFFDRLDAETQKKVLFAGAVFGAIRISAQQGKRLYGNKQGNILESTVSISIPKF